MGRRPKSDAIRRAHQQSEATIVEYSSLPMPDYIAESETMRECWEWTTAHATHFTQEHLPALITYVQWWAVARQCMANLTASDGRVITKIDTPMGPRQDPDVRTLQQATNAMRQGAVELGITPLASERMKLTRVATMSMAADLPSKVFRILDEHGD